MSGTKRWAAGLFIALIFMYNHGGGLAQGETSAKAACVMEMETGRVLFEYNARARLPMASTTKVMTALLAIENGDLSSEVTCSSNAFGVPGTSIYLAEGETLTLEQMLYGLMLASGNDAAVAIAEHIGGSVPQFVRMMNARAAELGAAGTHFSNPNGLPDDTHVTTAYDLARDCPRGDGQRGVSADRFHPVGANPWAGRTYSRQLRNKNRLLETYPGATGVKTGFTSRAGRCLVFGASRDGMELVGVVLNCSDWFDEAARLMDACFETYTMARVLGPTMAAGKIAVIDGRQASARLCAMQDLRVPLCEGESAQVVLDVPQAIRAPGYAGQHIGTAQVVVGGKTLASCEIVLSEYVESKRLALDVRRVVSRWML